MRAPRKPRKGWPFSLARQARYTEAEPLFKDLLEHEQVIGNERELASVLLNYGLHKQITGDYAAAEALLERAVALLGRAEPDSPQLAKSLNNLGLVYWRQGRERAAIKLFERALAIHVKMEGPHSGAMAPALTNLSLVHRDVSAARTALSMSDVAG
jgi:tetratricopeptide (TPR) repeat protein